MKPLMDSRRLTLALAVSSAVVIPSGSIPRIDRSIPTAPAQRQDFLDRLVESGTVSAARMHVYSSTLNGPAKLLFIVAEGARVRPGDVLARFDVSSVEQALLRERYALQQTEAERTRTSEEMRVEALRAMSDVEAAGQQARTAEETLANQTSGRGAVEVMAAEIALAEAERAWREARATRDDMKPLLDEGFVTRAEFDRTEQAVRRAEDQHKLAAARLEALVKFERPATLARAQADLAAARMQADRQASTGTARVRERQAALASLTSRAEEIRGRIAMLDEQVSRGVIVAQQPGLAVYREIYFGTEPRKPIVGDDVMPGQPILAVPDFETMTVETRIREIDLHRVAAGQAVRVQLDAYPGVELDAVLTSIGAIAQADPSRAGARFFPATVTINRPDARLRNGMTARVVIEAAVVAGALVAPAQAIVDVDGGSYVFVAAGGGFEQRPVTVLHRTATHAVIGSGLKEGERVRLAPPPARPAR